MTTSVATIPNDFVWRLPGAHTAGLWLPLDSAVFAWCFNAAFGLCCAFPRWQKRTISLWSQTWWEMVPDNYPPRIHGPMIGEKWSQHTSKYQHMSTDLSTSQSVIVDVDITCRSTYGRIRSISTSTVDLPTVGININRESTYGKIRSINDRRQNIETVFWSIPSTTPVQISEFGCTIYPFPNSQNLIRIPLVFPPKFD